MRWFPAIGGALATFAALMVLISLWGDASATAASDDTEVVVAPTTTSAPTVEETVVVASQPEPNLPSGIDPAVSQVLAGGGFTQYTPRSDLLEALPPDVVDALIQENAILVIPSEGS